MKNKILIFLFIFSLFGCKVSKSLTENTTTEKIEKNYSIDTVLKIVQPIKAFKLESNYDEPIRIENKDFVFESEISYDTGKRTYIFTPKNDTIKEKVKVNLTEKQVKTIINKKVIKDIETGFNFFKFLCVILGAFFIVTFIRYLIRKYGKYSK